MLTPQGPMGQAGGLCPWWVKAPGWFLSAHSSPALQSRGDERTDSLTLPEAWDSNSPFKPQSAGLQNRREDKPLVKLQESSGWTRPFLTPGWALRSLRKGADKAARRWGMVLMPSVTSTRTEAQPSFPTLGSEVPWLRPGLLGGRG